MTNHASDTISTICVTEKAIRAREGQNCYVFRVIRSATKSSVKQAVEELFKKRVVRVATMNVLGKRRRKRTAAAGFTSDWKKAMVWLADGETIDLV